MKNKTFDFLDIITKLKILRDRSMGWVSAFNLVMIGLLFFQNFPNKKTGLIIIVIGVIAIITLTILDYIFILPREQEYYLKVNQEWQNKIYTITNKK